MPAGPLCFAGAHSLCLRSFQQSQLYPGLRVTPGCFPIPGARGSGQHCVGQCAASCSSVQLVPLESLKRQVVPSRDADGQGLSCYVPKLHSLQLRAQSRTTGGKPKGDFREPCHPPRITSRGFYVHTSNQLLLEAFISDTLLRDWVQELISFKPQCSLGSAGTLGGVRRCQALCTYHHKQLHRSL